MESTIDNEKIIQAVKHVIVNTTVNNYAVERVAFGFEKPGDKAPIDLYIEHLPQLVRLYSSDIREDIPGIYIDENERISAEYDYDEYVRDLFVMQMERIFLNAPKDVRLERDGEELPLLPRFREYLFGLLPLFTEVLKGKIFPEFFDLISPNAKARVTEDLNLIKFVTAILLKPLKGGSRINRYVKNLSYAPHYVRRLIEKKGGNYYLKPVDVDSYEYIFALFSVMLFKNLENCELLELKMFKWELKHRSGK
ncbi:MAG: hypothetical protein K2M48_06270 [Clostridiales bacterium]|nr:hypothetical protein [Clostridiales bacterium]